MTTGADWTGAVGHSWAAEWRRTDRSFRALTPSLHATILALAPSRPFRACDIGCGAGQTSLMLAAARPHGEVIGVDLSAELVAVATARAEALRDGGSGRTAEDRAIEDLEGCSVRFVAGDAAHLAAAVAPVDLFVSRHGVMFFDDPVGAFLAFRRAAAPGARLVFTCFRGMEHNPWASELIEAAGGALPPAGPSGGEPAPGPFAFADPDHVQRILRAAGWRLRTADAVDFAYRAGEGVDPVADAVDFLQRIGPAARLIRDAAPADRDAVLARVSTALEARRNGDSVDLPASAWLWSAEA